MKILFIDDDPLRHEMAGNILAKEFEVTHARTIDEAIRWVTTVTFDVICFDYDMEASKRRTGADVARKMIESHRLPKYVWIHSWNLIGSRVISNIIAGRVKFGVAAFSDDSARTVAGIIRNL